MNTVKLQVTEWVERTEDKEDGISDLVNWARVEMTTPCRYITAICYHVMAICRYLPFFASIIIIRAESVRIKSLVKN